MELARDHRTARELLGARERHPALAADRDGAGAIAVGKPNAHRGELGAARPHDGFLAVEGRRNGKRSVVVIGSREREGVLRLVVHIAGAAALSLSQIEGIGLANIREGELEAGLDRRDGNGSVAGRLIRTELRGVGRNDLGIAELRLGGVVGRGHGELEVTGGDWTTG
ncbi:Uncharacterised protein [Collinsella intestinalis]|nr:Uncharacterised protein [Collinsella intestinalis]